MNKTVLLTVMLYVALAATACAPRPAAAPAPTATQPAAAAATSAPTDTPAPTAAPTDTPAPTAAPTAEPEFKAWPAEHYAHFPRDPDGRLIGLQRAPILNYSPTMIMGKPCPRIKRWGVRKVTPQPPAQPYYVVDNPCVIQNALDDGLRALFYWPSGYPDQEYYKREIVPLLKTDPVAQWALDEGGRRDFAEKLLGGYSLCNKPTYMLIDIDAGVPTLPRDGKHTGRVIHVRMIQVAGNAEPFTCKVYKRSTGEFWYEYGVREADMEGLLNPTGLLHDFQIAYNPETGRWTGEGFMSEVAPMLNYRERVLFLLEQSPVKP